MATRSTRLIGRIVADAQNGRRCLSTSSSGFRPKATRGGYLAGLVVLGGSALIYNQQNDISIWSKSSERFVVYADAAARPDYPATDKPGGFRATDIQFPVNLSLNTPGPLLTLVGLGVRTVSFLRVKVYSAGFYLEDGQTKRLGDISGWSTYSAEHMLTPPPKAPSDPLQSPQLSGEALMRNLLDQPVTCAVRIVPVRNTDFGHLRDGFTRAIAARQKSARVANQLSEADEERIAQSTQTLKSMFPAQSVPKGKALTLIRSANGTLIVEYEDKILGKVNDPWVSRELMLAYFADKDVISAKLKEDVAKGFEELIKHSSK